MSQSLEAAWEACVKGCFDQPDKIFKWLQDEKIRTSEDYGLLAVNEVEIGPNIIAPAKAASAHADKLAEKISFKKLWLRCKADEKDGGTSGEAAETELALCDRTRKTCEVSWKSKHGFTLHPGRRLVYTQMNPMHAMSHVMGPPPPATSPSFPSVG